MVARCFRIAAALTLMIGHMTIRSFIRSIRHDQYHAWLRYAEEAKVKAAKEALPLALSPSGTLIAPLAAWRPLA